MNYYKKIIVVICIVFYNYVDLFWNDFNCFEKFWNVY